MIKEIILHSIGTISWTVALAALLNLMDFTGYFAGYFVGVFCALYYCVGEIIIEDYYKKT